MAEHLDLLNRALLEVAAGRIKRLMVFMPPRHGKSTLTSLNFPAWYLGTFPEKRVILSSYEAGYATTWGVRVRDLMDEYGEDLWGVQLRRRGGADWELTEGGGMRSAGIGTGVTGRGADLIIIDDPVKDASDANSETKRRRAIEYYESTLSTRLEPGGAIVMIMTRWHEADLAGYLLEQAKKGDGDSWHVLNLPAEAVGDDDMMGRSEGDPLWPERWDSAALAAIKTRLTDYWWQALYQQAPAPPGGGMFERDKWRFYDESPLEMAQRTGTHEFIQSWDMTFKERGRSFVVGQVWCRIRANRFLLDQVRGHWGFVQSLNQVRMLTDKWPQCGAKLIEDKANGSAIVDALRNEISGITPVGVSGSKEERAEVILPVINAGQVHLPRNEPWVQGLIDETASFPYAPNDDQVDTLTQALHHYDEQDRSRAHWNPETAVPTQSSGWRI